MLDWTTARSRQPLSVSNSDLLSQQARWLKSSVSRTGRTWAFFVRQPTDQTLRVRHNSEACCVRSIKMARLEAVLLIADGALSERRLAQLATLSSAAETRLLIDKLNRAYDHAGSAFRIESVATGYQLLTRPVFARWLDKLHHRQSTLKLSPPAMETLTIVAYRQPVTRADVEAVRGVQCAEMLKQLMDRQLVRIGGEDDSLGRPYLYETTRRFLELFGLKNLDDLPMADQLRRTKSAKPTGEEEIIVPGETIGLAAETVINLAPDDIARQSRNQFSDREGEIGG